MKQRKPRRKLLILLLLVLGCVAVLATGTYAAYTSSAWVKRVAVAKNGESSGGLCFSSNLLYPYGSKPENGYDIRAISVGSSDQIPIDFTVCNYPLNDPSRINDSQIEYTVEIKSSLTGCTVTLDTSEGTLPHGIRSKNLHTLTVTPGENADISAGFIEVVVSPKAGFADAVDNKHLAARLKLVPTSSDASEWDGEYMLTDKYKDNDVINFRIFGTEQCEMYLVWNTALIELSDWSRELLKETGGQSGQLKISLGGPDQPTSYVLQFYRKVPASDAPQDQLGIDLQTITSS